MSAAGDTDVLVVGAGPTGLALAAELAEYGTRVRVVDRNLDRVRESRALAIQARTLEVLARLGLAEKLVASGNPAVDLRMHFPRRTVPMHLFDLGLEDTAYPFLLFLSQAETERVLSEHLTARGVDVERATDVAALHEDGDGVTSELRRDGATELVRSRFVVGCDGARSTVRRAAGIDFRGATYPQTFVLADLEADGVEAGSAHVFVSGDGLLFFFPLVTPATWRLLAMRPRGDVMPADARVTVGDVQALADRFAPGVRLRNPVWMTNFRIHNRGATRYRAGRMFIAGDAAHIHSPAGAQGMNTGIQDAANLGWKLALVVAGQAPPELLDTYDAERAPVGRMVLRFTDKAFTVGTSTFPLLRLARTTVAPRVVPVALRTSLVGRVLRSVAELDIGYRGSPLSVDGRGAPRRGPRAGDRVPDAPVNGRGGGRVTLHDLLAAPGFHLLVRASSGSGTAGERAIPDDELADLVRARPVTVHRLDSGDGWLATDAAPDRSGGDGGSLTLVRPDGYIGYRGGIDGLRDYLVRWLPRPTRAGGLTASGTPDGDDPHGGPGLEGDGRAR